jgi:Kef-type K+ transport system membrane component KefB
MIPRGEVCVAVARVGLGLGILRQTSYSIVVMTAVVAAAIAPPFLYLAFPNTAPPQEGKEEIYRLG